MVAGWLHQHRCLHVAHESSRHLHGGIHTGKHADAHDAPAKAIMLVLCKAQRNRAKLAKAARAARAAAIAAAGLLLACAIALPSALPLCMILAVPLGRRLHVVHSTVTAMGHSNGDRPAAGDSTACVPAWRHCRTSFLWVPAPRGPFASLQIVPAAAAPALLQPLWRTQHSAALLLAQELDVATLILPCLRACA